MYFLKIFNAKDLELGCIWYVAHIGQWLAKAAQGNQNGYDFYLKAQIIHRKLELVKYVFC